MQTKIKTEYSRKELSLISEGYFDILKLSVCHIEFKSKKLTIVG